MARICRSSKLNASGPGLGFVDIQAPAGAHAQCRSPALRRVQPHDLEPGRVGCHRLPAKALPSRSRKLSSAPVASYSPRPFQAPPGSLITGLGRIGLLYRRKLLSGGGGLRPGEAVIVVVSMFADFDGSAGYVGLKGFRQRIAVGGRRSRLGRSIE